MKESFKETTSNWKKEGRSTSTLRTFFKFFIVLFISHSDTPRPTLGRFANNCLLMQFRPED